MCFPLLYITVSNSTKFEIEIHLLSFHKSKVWSIWELYFFSSLFANKGLSRGIVKLAAVMLLTLWAQIPLQCRSVVILPGPALPSYPPYLPVSRHSHYRFFCGLATPLLSCLGGSCVSRVLTVGNPLFTSACECEGVSPHYGIIPDSVECFPPLP